MKSSFKIQARLFSAIFIFVTVLSGFSVVWADETHPRTDAPLYSIGINMKSNDENTALGLPTGQQPGVWYPTGNTNYEYRPGINEDGNSAYYVGGNSAIQMVFLGGNFGGGSVTQKDAAGNVIGTTYGFRQASEFVFRLKSTDDVKVYFQAMYSSYTKDSDAVILPSTGGEWKDVVLPISKLDTTGTKAWVNNMQSVYTTAYNPVIKCIITKVGSSGPMIIGGIKANWYADNVMSDFQITGIKNSYFQNHDAFDYSQGKIQVFRGDQSVLVDGAKIQSGSTSATYSPPASSSSIVVSSKAKDGTIRDYTVNVNAAASANPNLKSVTTNYGYMSPAFDKNVTDYTLVVPNAIGTTKVSFTCTAEDSATAITAYNASVTDGQVVTVSGTSQTGVKKDYKFTIVKAAPNGNDADLMSMMLTSFVANQPFDKNVTEYTADALSTLTSVKFRPIKDDVGATVTVNGVANTWNTDTSVTLVDGVNVIPIVVTAANSTVDNPITKTYTYTITRKPATDTKQNAPYLSGISGVTLSPTFYPFLYNYTATTTAESVGIKPTASNATYTTITVNGITTGSNVTQTIPLNMGSNTVTVVTTTKNVTPAATQTYTINVTRDAPVVLSGDNNLFSIEPSIGRLNESFNKDATSYTMNVGNATSALTLTAVKQSPYSSFTVNGKATTSGTASASIPLAVGTTTIPIVVTAQDATKKTYNIVVTRSDVDDANAKLIDLRLSAGVWSQPFNPDVATYDVQVPSNSASITATPFIFDSGATVTVNGAPVTNGSTSQGLLLEYGLNTVSVAVRSKNGTIQNYILNITRTVCTDTNNKLLSLTASQGVLSPAFSPDITNYTLTLPASVSGYTITPTKQDTLESVEELALDDPRVEISGYSNTTIKNDPDMTKNLRLTFKVFGVTKYAYVSIVPFVLPSTATLRVDAPKVQYNVGDPFDFGIGTVVATYPNGSEETVALSDKNVTVTGFDSSTSATNQIITVTYGGKTYTYPINIGIFEHPNLVSLTPVNVRKLYKVGMPFDWFTGYINAVATGAPDTKLLLYNRYMTVSGFDTSVAANNVQVTITYSGMTTTFPIDVIDGDLPIKYLNYSNMSDSNKPSAFGAWNGASLSYVDGKAEDGTSSALVYSSAAGSSGPGSQVAFYSGSLGGTVTQPDGTKTNALVGVDAIKFRVKSSNNVSIQFQQDYRATSKATESSKSYTIPSTGGEWKDIVIPISAFEPTQTAGTLDDVYRDSINWVHNMRSILTTDYEPILLMRITGSTNGNEAIFGRMEAIRYETKPVDSISVIGQRTNYLLNSSFDSNKGAVVITYKDGTTATTTLSSPGLQVTGFDSSQAAENMPITVTYAGLTASYTVNILENATLDEMVLSSDVKNEYIIGQPFDYTKGTVTLKYTDDLTETLTLDDPRLTIAGFDSSATATAMPVTITFQDDHHTKSIAYNVNVVADYVTSITLSGQKTAYLLGDTFDYSTGIIHAVYASGLTEDVLFDQSIMVVTGFDTTTESTNRSVTVRYKGFQKSYSTTVSDPIQKFKVTFNPQNGNANTVVNVHINEYVQKPADPVMAGYDFKGWYTEGTYDNLWDFGTPVNSNINLYAKWEEKIIPPTPAITVSDAENTSGSEVEVAVSIANNPGLAVLAMKLHFDNSKLTPVSVTSGDILVASDLNTNIDDSTDWSTVNYVSAMWLNPTDMTSDGALFTVKFKIKDGVANGASPLYVTYEQGDIINSKYDDLNFDLFGGNIYVGTFVPGDIYIDGKVNAKDILRLSQYLAVVGPNLNTFQKKAADMFYDGEIDAKDALRLSQYLVGMDVTLGN